jgi:hypothetical protein
MELRKRLYETVVREHLERHRQMAFVCGPRQVGKTTTCRSLGDAYLDWDNTDHRRTILRGPSAVAEWLGLARLRGQPRVAVFDELHKFSRWKAFLKGFYDTYSDASRVMVTGSSRLDVYRKGGDSLMGRYFMYRMHPFTVAEVASQDIPDEEAVVRKPRPIGEADFRALWEHGGFPEPFVKREARFTRRWSGLRTQQMLREEIREVSRIHELGQVEALVAMLLERSGEQLVYSNLAQEVQVSVDTLRRWVATLVGLHVGFLVRPYFRNVARSVRKAPKWFLRDWAGIADEGKRAETFVACHLLKAVEGWTDLGLGEFQLGYLRDREKREVDFVVVRDRRPWLLVEVKKSDGPVSAWLAHFQKLLAAPHAVQAVIELDYVGADSFGQPGRALVVPAKTFLSQLF